MCTTTSNFLGGNCHTKSVWIPEPYANLVVAIALTAAVVLVVLVLDIDLVIAAAVVVVVSVVAAVLLLQFVLGGRNTHVDSSAVSVQVLQKNQNFRTHWVLYPLPKVTWFVEAAHWPGLGFSCEGYLQATT